MWNDIIILTLSTLICIFAGLFNRFLDNFSDVVAEQENHSQEIAEIRADCIAIRRDAQPRYGREHLEPYPYHYD